MTTSGEHSPPAAVSLFAHSRSWEHHISLDTPLPPLPRRAPIRTPCSLLSWSCVQMGGGGEASAAVQEEHLRVPPPRAQAPLPPLQWPRRLGTPQPLAVIDNKWLTNCNGSRGAAEYRMGGLRSASPPLPPPTQVEVGCVPNDVDSTRHIMV